MHHRFAMRTRLAILVAALLAVAPPLRAQEAVADVADDDLYKRKFCFACHRLDRTENGPAFRSVAAKYANDTTALAVLSRKIRAGGGGVWGPDVMPAQTQVTEAEARALVRWILALRAAETTDR